MLFHRLNKSFFWGRLERLIGIVRVLEGIVLLGFLICFGWDRDFPEGV